MSAHERPRACLRCHVVKDAGAFPARGLIDSAFARKRRGDGPLTKPGVTRVCMTCIETEAWRLHAVGYLPQRRTERRARGQALRFCIKCRVEKPVAEFPVVKDVKTRTCAECRAARSAAAKAEAMRREGDALRAREARRARERRVTDAAFRRRESEARKRWRAKLLADPKRHAEYLERERLARRMNKERAGNGTGKPAPGRMIEHGRVTLPGEPLAALIDTLVERRKAVAGLIADVGGASTEAVCADLGVTSRTMRRWRKGEEGVGIGKAEAILRNAGVEWHEVYSYDDHAEAFLAHEGVT